MKRTVSTITLFLLLASAVWFLVTNLFFSNYFENWQEDGYRVTEIVDGDTIEVQGRFSPFRVRYIGIDTPETEKPNQRGECYAEEARKKNRDLIGDKKVFLEVDKENLDRYDRELRYVYIKDNNELKMINLELIRGGYAKSLKIQPNVKYSDEIKKIEAEAKKEKRGMWGKCAK